MSPLGNIKFKKKIPNEIIKCLFPYFNCKNLHRLFDLCGRGGGVLKLRNSNYLSLVCQSLVSFYQIYVRFKCQKKSIKAVSIFKI